MYKFLSNNFRVLKNGKINCSKWYHSENVFGFRKKVKEDYLITEDILQNRSKESNFYRLVTAYREHGHKKAEIDPVCIKEHIKQLPELNISRYSLENGDRVNTKGILECDKDEITVQEAVIILENSYAKHISAEFSYLEEEEEREWFAKEFEKLQHITIDDKVKIQMAKEMLKAQEFDRFLAAKYPGLKRYGGEGAEGMIPFFMELFRLSAKEGISEIVSGMPHRGRLNILTGLLQYPPSQIFLRLKGEKDYPGHYQATGDVLSHINASVDLHYGNEKVHVTVLKNPSHLEAVNPVSVGKTRAKQMMHRDGDYGRDGRLSDKILNLQVHGDAALMGQGVNQETLNMSQTPHFEVGGSIHMVTNNQLGFTTPAERGRSSRYCTDLAKMISAPVVHVNGDHPELVFKATKLVFDYQRKFRKDVFLDINCYRQWGHNELDDPSFTNPLMYKIIRSKKTVPDLYSEKLIADGLLTEDEKNDITSSHSKWLNDCYKSCDSFQPQDPSFNGNWKDFEEAKDQVTVWDTGVDSDVLTFLGMKSVQYPDTFNIHPTLLKSYVKNRLSKISEGAYIDWATAETLAFGSLLYEGFNVRISGQDVGRGTFSHRHVMLVDQETNELYIPLNHLHKDQQGFLEIANSTLSEEAVIGFEYGFSLESPRNLCIWEAQFGDFFNGAQIPVDTFVTCGETKWLYSSGLTMLLPHGYDGAGPDHSSARIERILLQTDSKEDRVDGDNVNLQVCQPSTPAQYFHLLRRQVTQRVIQKK
ncbi:probable 2-oxoglutarate dehydrogenase E1 component DHKTD1, mitochondrial isoform X2 [Coccinella septempunctata]|uniref:probable 2-oxoglutarate dehydrogenase E1 component DHKTD1, mitochondrial isoform X2 n=1 Tax=Coccinella septempunctata TaxID=41139 RepID=UPI001D08646E|nr:probable 2-oxoglutarate dehydrogenase E1 component DHKTD1, mitochondrial isoform X2 [Coccinella septempunctata]